MQTVIGVLETAVTLQRLNFETPPIGARMKCIRAIILLGMVGDAVDGECGVANAVGITSLDRTRVAIIRGFATV